MPGGHGIRERIVRIMAKILEKLRRFMSGRYGADPLCFTLLALSMLFSFAGRAARQSWTLIPTWLLLGFAVYRMMSRDYEKRAKENRVFLRLWNPVAKWFRLQYNRFRDRKTHRYFTCPGCRNALRVPKGKGEITITCPVCREKFDRKT